MNKQIKKDLLKESLHPDLNLELINSSFFLASVFEASPISMWVSDAYGTLIRMNDACRESLQITDADVVGKYNILRDNIIESQGFMPMVKQVFTEKKIARFTVMYDTAYVHELSLAQTVNLVLDVSISPILDEHGKLLHAIIQHKDITAKTKIEAILKQSDERVRNLIENLDVGVLQQGPHAEILLANAKALELLGLTKDQILGKTSFDPDWNVIHEDGSDFPGSTHPVPVAIETQKPVRNVVMGVYRPKTKDREWLLVNAVPEFKMNGELDHVVCTFRSITEKRKIEDERNSQLKRYKMLMETSQDAIHILDDGLKLVECNTCFIKHLGYSEEEILNMYVWEWDAQMNKEELLTLLSASKPSGISFGSIHRLKDGSFRNVDIRVHRFSDNNKIYYYASARDISLQKIQELEMLRLNHDLRELGIHSESTREEERTAIAKEIHDELAQNLVALSMNASYLKSKLKKEENRLVLDDQIEIANELINTSRTLFNSLHPSMLDEIGLAAAIKWYTKTKLKSSSIQFCIQSSVAEEMLPKNIRLGLFRIFQESFTNALRHSRSKNITVELTEINKRVFMLIRDDGQGFDAEQIDSKLHHGILGIRERVYAMSGEFRINSQIGNGTSIRVEVPI